MNLLNLLLIGLLVLLLRYTFYPSPEPEIKLMPSQQKGMIENEKEKTDSISLSPADYMVVAEQNPFHPERKIPVAEKAEQPLPKPEFVLYGTLITDDLSIAYMEDLKAPISTPGRGNRQSPLRIGQSLSGFTLKEIEPEKVVMVRGEERMTLHLNDPNTQKKRETVVAATLPGKSATATAPTTPATQKMSSASGEQQKIAIVPPLTQREKPKEPLTSEQAKRERDAFLKFFQRR